MGLENLHLGHELFENIAELEILFKIMKEQHVERLELGLLKIEMQHPYVYMHKSKEIALADSDQAEVEPESQPVVAKPVQAEEKQYSNDEILLDPYVGLGNG